ncbi:MAG: GDSL-type esterase/lipase family protein [Planctomycetota bacterium]
MSSRAKKILLALLGPLAVLAIGEIVLRAAGFRYLTTLTYLQFGYPRPEQMVALFEPDAELFWKLRLDVEGINARGFRGPDLSQPKAPGALRIVMMGDSCTFGVGAEVSLPAALLEELARRRRERPVEVLNAGVPGYTTHQGRRLLRRDILPLQPDIVIISYVWNDHWLARGFTDREQRLESATMLRLRYRLESASRIWQFLEWGLECVRSTGRAQVPASEVRVPLADYRENLQGIVQDCAGAGIRPVLMTAPSRLRESVPAHLVPMGFVESPAQAIERHALYNEVVRETAREQGVLLVDLENELEREGHPDWFLSDNIHFTSKGHVGLALLIADFLVEKGLLE